MICISSPINQIKKVMTKDWMTSGEISMKCSGKYPASSVAQRIKVYGDDAGIESTVIKYKHYYRLTGNPRLDDESTRVIETIKELKSATAKEVCGVADIGTPASVGNCLKALMIDFPIKATTTSHITTYTWEG